MESKSSFDVDEVHKFLKKVWTEDHRAGDKRLRDELKWPQEGGVKAAIAPKDAGGSSKKPRTTANSNALKVICELLRLFVSEAIQRAGLLTKKRGLKEIDETHLRRIVSQLLHDF